MNNLSSHHSELGQQRKALALAEEAISINRQLIQDNRPVYLSGLAVALANLGVFQTRTGRPHEALGPAEEAVAVYRELTMATGPRTCPISRTLWRTSHSRNMRLPITAGNSTSHARRSTAFARQPRLSRTFSKRH
jgi:hypothetical protein